MDKKKLLGSLLLVLTAVIWGTAFVFQRTGMEQIEPFTFSASRMTLAAAAIGIVSLFFKDSAPSYSEEIKKTRRKNTVIGGILCGIFLAAGSIFQQIGLVYTTAGKAGFITALYMLIVPILNLIIFRKRSPFTVWIAVLMGIFGMYLLCMNGGFSLSQGDTYVVICAFMFSGHILCCDRFVEKCNPVKLSAMQFVAAAAVSWIAAFIMETPSVDKLISAAVPILYCGIISGGVGYTLQIVAQRFTDPTVASLLMSLESVFAVIAGAVFLNEQMSVRELIGCAVMFAAIILVQIPIKQKQKSNKQNNTQA